MALRQLSDKEPKPDAENRGRRRHKASGSGSSELGWESGRREGGRWMPWLCVCECVCVCLFGSFQEIWL